MGASGAPINGFLNVYKSPGSTSMEVVRQIKRISGQRKRVGHGGTLDPIAEGVLPICFGQATRLMEYLIESYKQYRMEVRLGAITSTYDSEGEVVETGDPSGLTLEVVEEALNSFQGTTYQTPPMYSAIKRGGKRLYELARSGIEVERQPRKVDIPRIEVLDFSPPTLVLKVDSGRGAYMRSLAHDLGEALGCGGYVRNLVRLRLGPFKVEEAIHLPDLIDINRPDYWTQVISPLDFVLLHIKSAAVPEAAERYIRRGQAVRLPPQISIYAEYMERYRLYTHDGRFLAVAHCDKPRDQWRPYKVFSLDTPSEYAPDPGEK